MLTSDSSDNLNLYQEATGFRFCPGAIADGVRSISGNTNLTNAESMAQLDNPGIRLVSVELKHWAALH